MRVAGLIIVVIGVTIMLWSGWAAFRPGGRGLRGELRAWRKELRDVFGTPPVVDTVPGYDRDAYMAEWRRWREHEGAQTHADYQSAINRVASDEAGRALRAAARARDTDTAIALARRDQQSMIERVTQLQQQLERDLGRQQLQLDRRHHDTAEWTTRTTTTTITTPDPPAPPAPPREGRLITLEDDDGPRE